MNNERQDNDKQERQDTTVKLTDTPSVTVSANPPSVSIENRLNTIDRGIFWAQLGIVVTFLTALASIGLQYFKVI